MKLLGTNNGDCILPVGGDFSPYYRKPNKVSTDKKTALFYLKRKPKYRFVTVPKTTRYENVFFVYEGQSPFDGSLSLKEGDVINIVAFGAFAA